jgi:hypothetical protein
MQGPDRAGVPDQEHDLARMDSDVATKHGAKRPLPRPLKLPSGGGDSASIQASCAHSLLTWPQMHLQADPLCTLQGVWLKASAGMQILRGRHMSQVCEAEPQGVFCALLMWQAADVVAMPAVAEVHLEPEEALAKLAAPAGPGAAAAAAAAPNVAPKPAEESTLSPHTPKCA